MRFLTVIFFVVVRRETGSFSSQCVFALTFLGLDGRDPGLARGVERRIAPLKFRKAERESFNRNRRKSPECARGDQQSESLNRKTPWPRPHQTCAKRERQTRIQSK